MSVEYAIVVKNKTRLETLIARFNTKAQAKFYIERSGGNFLEYEQEHDNFHQSLSIVQRHLSTVIKNKIIERSFLSSFIFTDNQVVIVIGQDGLVANTAKYVNGIPIIAVNPDKERYDGFLLPFDSSTFIDAVKQVIQGNYQYEEKSLAEVVLHDGQRLLAFNDLFIGSASHVSARYSIQYLDKYEDHSSSGIIVSTLAGSTGWLSSIFNMAKGLNGFLGKKKTSTQPPLGKRELLFVVREPFASKKSQTGIVAGKLSDKCKLVVESYMPANGVIFSDGIENDFLKFNSGTIATIGVAHEKAKLIVAR